MQQVPVKEFHDGYAIPQLGFGVWQVPAEVTSTVIDSAISAGFRSFDTAEAYYNEQEVGIGLRRSGLARDAFFITTKLWNTNQGRDQARLAFDASMQRLGVDMLDLYLMHWPSQARDLYVETWRTFADLQKQGRIRSIGVSNFSVAQLQRLIDETGVVPVVNQIELHPRFQQTHLRAFHEHHGIVTESWSPLGVWPNGRSAMDDPIVLSIATKHGRSPAQIVLRWHLQEGLVVLTRSVRPERIRENCQLFDFELDDDDMRQIRSMDNARGRLGPDPETAEF
jgi:2,5-diketo-D-gluconate reductase A